MAYEEQDASFGNQGVNPRAFDVGATTPVGAVPGGQPALPPPIPTTPAAPQPQAAPSQTAPTRSAPQVTPQQADSLHHEALGRAARFIMGQTTSYQTDPQTGKTVAVQTPTKPGAFWKAMLTGALLGGEAGAGAPTFVGGVAKGGAAEIKDLRLQDEKKIEQSRKEAEAQQKAKEEDVRNQMNIANTARFNAETLKVTQELQLSKEAAERARQEFGVRLEGLQMDNVSKAVAMGQASLQPFLNADPNLVKYSNIPEDKMKDLIANNPQAHNLAWMVTDTEMGTDPKTGQPTHKLLLSGVDQDGMVKTTPGWLKYAQDNHLEQIIGQDAFKNLVVGKEIPARQFINYTKAIQNKFATDLQQEKDKLTVDEVRARTQNYRAEAAKNIAEANKNNKEAKEKSDENTALNLISGADGNVKMLNLSFKQRVAAAKVYEGEEAKDISARNSFIANGDSESAKKMTHRIFAIQQILDDLHVTPTIGGTGAATQKAGEQSPEVKDKVADYEGLMKQDKIEEGSTDTYDYLNSKVPETLRDPVTKKSYPNPAFTDDVRIARNEAIKKYAVVPWSVIVDTAAKQGVPINKIAKQFKDKGYKMEYESIEDKKKKDDEFYKKQQEGMQLMP